MMAKNAVLWPSKMKTYRRIVLIPWFWSVLPDDILDEKANMKKGKEARVEDVG